MATCQAEARERARDCADALLLHESVKAVDTLPPQQDPTALWTVEATLRPRAGGLPDGPASEIAGRGLTVRRVCRRGDHWHTLATV